MNVKPASLLTVTNAREKGFFHEQRFCWTHVSISKAMPLPSLPDEVEDNDDDNANDELKPSVTEDAADPREVQVTSEAQIVESGLNETPVVEVPSNNDTHSCEDFLLSLQPIIKSELIKNILILFISYFN